jgi:hypothetical protein
VQLKVFWATLLRRWYFVILVLIGTVAASYFVVDKIGPTYEAKGAVLLFPPVTSVQQGSKSGTVGNPYLMLGGLNNARDIVIRALTAKATREELCQQRSDIGYEAMRSQLCKPRPSVMYEAAPDFTNSAPIVLITVDAGSATNAVTGLNAVMERIPAVLTDLQEGLNLEGNAEITSLPLVTDRQPDVVHKDQIRAGIVVGAGTLGLGLLMIGLLDGLAGARRSRGTAHADTRDASAESGDQPRAIEAEPVYESRAMPAETDEHAPVVLGGLAESAPQVVAERVYESRAMPVETDEGTPVATWGLAESAPQVVAERVYESRAMPVETDEGTPMPTWELAEWAQEVVAEPSEAPSVVPREPDEHRAA